MPCLPLAAPYARPLTAERRAIKGGGIARRHPFYLASPEGEVDRRSRAGEGDLP